VSKEKAKYSAGQPAPETFTLTVDREELIILNQSLILWLADVQKEKSSAVSGNELDKSIDETIVVTRRVHEKIEKLLGEQ
jgi:hypothetical protein